MERERKGTERRRMKSVEYIKGIQGYRRAVDAVKVACGSQYSSYNDILFITWPMLFNMSGKFPDWLDAATVVKSAFCQLEQSNLFIGVMADEPPSREKIIETYGGGFWAEAEAEGGGSYPAEKLEMASKGVADWQWKKHIWAAAGKEVGKEEDKDMVQTLIWAVSIAAVIIAFLIVRAKITQPSDLDEFRAIRGKAAQATWARKLLKAGPRLTGLKPWSVEVAWQTAIEKMTDDEVREAMAFFINAQPGFTQYHTIDTRWGERYDPGCMETVGPAADWVFKVERSGLKKGTYVLQRAKVQCASADYLALEKTRESELTRTYLKHAKQDLTKGRTLRLDTGAILGVQDITRDLSIFNDWIRSLAAAAGKELLVLEPEVGGRYKNEEMYCVTTEDNILTLSQARVTKVLSIGLRRADKTLVLRALVEARD